jgi:hypothetical protein
VLRKMIITLLLLTAIGAILACIFANLNFLLDWRTASRASANLAPLPQQHHGAIVQIYAARTYSWRGLFAEHMWLATKEEGAQHYKVYQVVGWLKYYGRSPLSIAEDIPDRLWFNQKPHLIKDLRGAAAARAISKIEYLAPRYPHNNSYTLWPGPNSNTFIAYLMRNIPELNGVVSPLAIGKDYLPKNGNGSRFFARTPSGTGYQFSFFGTLGVALAKDEGLEINVLGLVFGINPKKLSIILPCIGYVGFLSK